jgi:hypothetical protein
VLTREPNFSWLDQDSGWFWITNVPRNRVLNQIEKVLSVAGSLSVTELRTAVARNYRMEGTAPPRRVLAELCRQSPRYRVDDEVVRADPPLSPSDILGETELTFVTVLTAHGSVMSRAALENECRSRGMNKVTFYVYLKNSPILICPRRGVYALVGATMEPGKLEALVVRPMRSRVIIDSGWTSNEKLWIVYRLSENMVTSGVLGVPAGAKSIIEGDFTLLDDQGNKIGTIRSRDTGTWGLGPFFHRRGGVPGEYLALVFDLVSRAAVATLGDESIIDRFVQPDSSRQLAAT